MAGSVLFQNCIVHHALGTINSACPVGRVNLARVIWDLAEILPKSGE